MISRRLRERAILTCLLIADTHIALGDYAYSGLYPETDEAMDDLLNDAAFRAPLVGDAADLHLEIAALLRDGWSPGERVRVLTGGAR